MDTDAPEMNWTHPGCLRFRETTFHLALEPDWDSTLRDDDDLVLLKSREMLEDYVGLVPEFAGANIVELGIKYGGSTAFLAALLDPRRLVALDLCDPVRRLETHLSTRGIEDRVRPHFNVDQADEAKLRSILDDEFGDDHLDLVIDDASHWLDATRASFDVLFPRLRPGGLYVIEDWSVGLRAGEVITSLVQDPTAAGDRAREKLLQRAADPTSAGHRALERELEERLAAGTLDAAALAQIEGAVDQSATRASTEPPDAPPASATRPTPPTEPHPWVPEGELPLAVFIMELLLIRAGISRVVGEITLGPYWVTVRRGDEDIDPQTFRSQDVYVDPFGTLPRTGAEHR